MCSSPYASPSPSSLLPPSSSCLSLLRLRTGFSIFSSSTKKKASLIHHHSSRNPRLLLSPSNSISYRSSLHFSWFAPDTNAIDDCGGWGFPDPPFQENPTKNRMSAFVVGGVGVSFAVLVAVVAQLSLTRKGFKFQFSSASSALRLLGMFMSNDVEEDGSEAADAVGSCPGGTVSEASAKYKSTTVSDTQSSEVADKCEHVIIPIDVDSTQQEAVQLLMKLKIIEDNVKVDELCTRREYARWLIRSNLLLERNPKHQMIPSVLPSESVISAFDDVSTRDPDYWFIQALAEAGMVPSKLSGMKSNLDADGSGRKGGVYFFPERFVSREDLISWKAQLEYELMPGIERKIAKVNVGFMDAKEINDDLALELFMDTLAGDNSIHRKVFGQSKRFQPNKPSTKAQAAVAVACGKMAEAISAEMLRLEAENSSMQAAMEEIRSELLAQGHIQNYWDKKLEVEKNHGVEVERAYLAAVNNLEQGNIILDKSLAEYLKEKAAIDCQRQLLLSLKEEVSEMSERFACERHNYMAEQRDLQNMFNHLMLTWEGRLEAKSVLEAEKEALRILRSWVEDEARKNQARAKVLEEVGRRWKWENES